MVKYHQMPFQLIRYIPPRCQLFTRLDGFNVPQGTVSAELSDRSQKNRFRYPEISLEGKPPKRAFYAITE